jgi:hypothetical protein
VFILEDNTLSSMGNSGIPEENIIFQQDNKPKSSSKRAQIWFKSHGIRLLDWPAKSQILALLSIFGNISRNDSIAVKDQKKEFWSSGRELRQSGGR